MVTNKKIIKKYLILTIASITMAFTLKYFIFDTMIFSTGLAGFTQGITYTITLTIEKYTSLSLDYSQLNLVLYWGIYIILNIPIIIFSYIYFGKRFLFNSLYVLLTSLAFSMLFNYIPGLDTASFFNIQETEDPALKNMLIIISSFIGGVIYGWAVAMVLKNNTTSLGIDPIARYLSREKGINISIIFFSFSVTNSIFWIIVLNSIAGNITSWNDFINNVLFSSKIVASIIYLGVYSIVASYFYQSSDKILVEINTEKYLEISNKFNEINYHRGHSIQKIIGGFSKKERGIMKFVLKNEEVEDVVGIVRNIDPSSFIFVTKIKRTIGNHVWSTKTFEDIEHKNREHKHKHNH